MLGDAQVLLSLVTDLIVDFRCLSEHRSDRAVHLLRQVHGILNRFVRNVPAYFVGQRNMGKTEWCVVRPFRFRRNLDACEGFSLLTQDVDHVVASATAKAD